MGCNLQTGHVSPLSDLVIAYLQECYVIHPTLEK